MTAIAAATYSGTICPQTADFGFVQGAQPAIGNISVMGSASLPLGSTVAIQIGSSSFVGFIVSQIQDSSSITGVMSKVTAVDWRDRLSDNYVFAAFNVQESDGRTYHILPSNWATQQRTWSSQQLAQADFQNAQNIPANQNIFENVANFTLFSCTTLINYLAKVFNFQWNAESFAGQIMSKSRPLNLDWNAGVTGAEALQQVLSKCGLQFTAYGMNQIFISLRGFSSNAFVNAYLNGASICNFGATEGSVGTELNERGQRVILIGDRNKYQFTYACRQDWNPKWTAALCFDGWTMAALLKTNNLTLKSKLKDMPKDYQDDATWTDFNDWTGQGAMPAHVTRNEMFIQDYLDKVCYRIYVVDAGRIATNYKIVNDVFTGTAGFTNPQNFGQLIPGVANAQQPMINFDPTNRGAALDFQWPPSDKLITDSNVQYMCLATSQKVINGVDSPLESQLVFVPKDQGHSLHVEEVISNVGSVSYKVRITFNEPQVNIDQTKKDTLDNRRPDTVLVPLCVDRELFTYWQGAIQNIPRVRTQKQSVRHLYQAFLNGVEVSALAMNFAQDQAKVNGPQDQAGVIKAIAVAKILAQQLLYHQAVTQSGHLHFENSAGFTPDGLIDTVSVSFDAEAGFTESVNFSTGWLDLDNTNTILQLRVSVPLKMEDDIIRDRLDALRRAAMKDKNVVKRVMALFNSGIQAMGSILKDVPLFGHFGGGSKAPGTLKIKLSQANLTNMESVDQSDLIILGKKAVASSDGSTSTTPIG